MEYKVLRDIGLTQSEIKVYLALLKLGSTTSGPLTDKSGVARSKIYEVLERLINKSLVSYIIKQKTKHYQAEDPAKIQEFLNKKEKEFKQQRNKIDKLIPQLQLEKQLAKKPSEAQIYSGFRGIQTVHEHMYQKLKRGDNFFYLGIPASQKKEHHLYWQRDHKRREKAGLISRALFNKNTDRNTLKNRNSYKYSEARYIPLPVKTPAWIMGYKDVTVIGLQSNEGMAIEIINQEIADSFREYFEAFWKLSKSFK
jgi:sugar-specific transcriptional regulator TrmB